MKDIIVVFEKGYIYKGKEYFLISELKKKLKNNFKREIFIIDEEIFIKSYNYNEKNSEVFVEENIQKDFIDNKELLYHYEEDKKNKKIYLYAIRKMKIENIINSKVKIIPISFLIKDIILKDSKLNNFIAIVEISGKFYVVFVEEKNLVKYEMLKDIEKVKDILNNNDNKNIFIDAKYEGFATKKLEIKINILEKINEKIYKKQKLFT
ncbi:hypothetical protein [Clostridium sp.]|uniref:hypothetical protein n=1 Tax=Clostridium sp. TaxID=1506 RepID=UPI00261EFC2C|nr:hypothetical protein [Clostridium sp.]